MKIVEDAVMEIRLLRHDEVEKLVRARLDFFRIFFPEWTAEAPESEKTQMADNLRAYYNERLGNGIEAAAALENGRIVSAAILTVSRKSPTPSAPLGYTGELANVLTYPEYQRRGLASGVLKLLLEKAADLGLERIDLQASREGEGLYKKLGFTAYEGHLPMRLFLNKG
ncbi:hypothetical protein C4J81_17540 [Deltaproteobacteria bacterium Smac51]|nr:hypothetical protein C4J81_17540 [Deltaproteobacteria bacterium Smac51]